MTGSTEALSDGGSGRDVAFRIRRGVMRMLTDLGYRSLAEFTLKNSRRADVIGLDRRGDIVIVEVKSSAADFRSDTKWQEYLEYCDRYYFAVAEDFPRHILPPDQGLIIADGYGAEVIIEAETRKVNAARRKTLTLKFARTAAQRLSEFNDPKL
jgi:hypothetical protein